MRIINEKVTVEGLNKKDVKRQVKKRLNASLASKHGRGKAIGFTLPASAAQNIVIDPESVFAINGVRRTYRAIGIVL